ncbi:MAG: hypothetical protein CBC42_01560 [Betaproteobacteria bacterium TMED82]|nr:MAG: hypothetical protein CBC42_01560 [Betaproteobacteria bacterium TMED82]|tara:strand:+ start:44920 stop:45183 length:264 start_codon:yes stop_codon:yes gene_type:complete
MINEKSTSKEKILRVHLRRRVEQSAVEEIHLSPGEYEGIKSGKVDVESIAQKFYGQNTGYENIGWKEIDAEQFSVQSYTVGSFEVDD